MYAPPDPYVTVRSQQDGGVRPGAKIEWMEIKAIVPVATTMDYSERIKPITKDRQSISLNFHSYQKMFPQRAKELESKLNTTEASRAELQTKMDAINAKLDQLLSK